MSEVLASKSLKEKYPTIIKNFVDRLESFTEQEKIRTDYLKMIGEDPMLCYNLYQFNKYIKSLIILDQISIELRRIISNISEDNISNLIQLLKKVDIDFDSSKLISIVARPISNDDFFDPSINRYNLKSSEFVQKNQIFIEKLMNEFVFKKDFVNLQELFLKFYTNESVRKAALNLVLEPSIDDYTRLEIAKTYINSYGFITLIDLISEYARNEASRPEIKKLYATLNAQEFEDLVQVYRNPGEIYKIEGIFPKEHYSEDTTDTEIRNIFLMLKNLKIDRNKASVLDLGAGRGRITFGLADYGVGKVYSVDIDETLQNSVINERKIAKNGDRIEVVQGDWYTLSENPEIEKVDLGVCVGRSLPHANNMNFLVRALSQMTMVSDNWLIDYPDSSAPGYDRNIQNLRSNFERLGINGRNALTIFDGPVKKHSINRMVASEDQLKKIGKLLGFTVEKIGEYGINSYYSLTNKKDWNYLDLTFEEVKEICQDLGLIFPEALDTVLPRWNATIAQVLGFYYYVKVYRDVYKFSGKELSERLSELKNHLNLENTEFRHLNNNNYPKASIEILEDGSRILKPTMGLRGIFYNSPPIIYFK